MSLNRLLLRLAVVNTLSPQPTDKHAPTLAGNAVFDTRLDDIEFDDEGLTELPIIQVYTDSDENVSYSTANGETDGYRHILLRIIFAVGTFQTSIADGKRNVVYGLPTTDAELEALLDIFEWQIIRALQHPVRPASTALRKLILSWDSYHSEPSRSADKNNRLAERTLTMRVRIPQDCQPVAHIEGTPQAALVGTQTGVPTFPGGEYLNDLIATLAKNPANGGLVEDLRELVTGVGSVIVPRFRRSRFNIDSIDPADPNLLAILNRASGPDGRIEAQIEWTIP